VGGLDLTFTVAGGAVVGIEDALIGKRLLFKTTESADWLLDGEAVQQGALCLASALVEMRAVI